MLNTVFGASWLDASCKEYLCAVPFLYCTLCSYPLCYGLSQLGACMCPACSAPVHTCWHSRPVSRAQCELTRHVSCSTITELTNGTSRLHMDPTGKAKTPPSEAEVKEQVTKLACAYNLVTPYTSSVGVLLQSDPVDPSKVKEHEIPIQVGTLLAATLLCRYQSRMHL